jgi:hypothetical protein
MNQVWPSDEPLLKMLKVKVKTTIQTSKVLNMLTRFLYRPVDLQEVRDQFRFGFRVDFRRSTVTLLKLLTLLQIFIQTPLEPKSTCHRQ